jgi:WD40 repeat protein
MIENSESPGPRNWVRLVAIGTMIGALILSALYAAIVFIPLWLAGPSRVIADLPSLAFSVGLSHDGKRLATGHITRTGSARPSEDRAVRVWSAETGRLELTLSGHRSDLIAAVFSPDGRWIAAGDIEGTVIIWDAAGGKTMHMLAESNSLLSLAFSPDSKWLATSNRNVWEVATGKLVRQIANPCGGGGVVFSPDMKQIAAASSLHGLSTCDVQSSDGARTLGSLGFGLGWYVAYFPDGRRILAHALGREPVLWDSEARQRLLVSGPRAPDRAVISADGRWLVSAQSTTIEVRETATWTLARTLRLRTNRSVHALAVSADGKRIAALGYAAIEIWDLR